MATEPERLIEKLLRRWASERRSKGSNFELHPATRRLLQGEVSRCYPRQGAADRRRFTLSFWPKFAFGTAGMIALLLGVSVFLLPLGRAKKEHLMARNDTAGQATMAESATGPEDKDLFLRPPLAQSPEPNKSVPAPSAPESEAQPLSAKAAPVNVPAANAVPIDKSRDGDAQVQLRFGGVAGTGAAAGSAPVREEAFKNELLRPDSPAGSRELIAAEGGPANGTNSDAALSVAAATRPAEPAVSAGGLSSLTTASRDRSFSLADSAPGSLPAKSSQRFVRVATPKGAVSLATKPALAAQSVLVSFSVEQSGEEVRVVDGDGSVYSGYIQPSEVSRAGVPATAESARAATPQRKMKVAAPIADRQPTSYFFRVTGTNRTLDQQVIFTGTLLPGGTERAVARSSDSTFTSNRSRLSGKVIVGNRETIELQAVPPPPP